MDQGHFDLPWSTIWIDQLQTQIDRICLVRMLLIPNTQNKTSEKEEEIEEALELKDDELQLCRPEIKSFKIFSAHWMSLYIVEWFVNFLFLFPLS